MTRMLVRVATAGDAAIVASAGGDIVEVVVPGHDIVVLRAIRAAFPGTLRLRLESLSPADDSVVQTAFHTALTFGADEIAVAFEDVAAMAPGIAALGGAHVTLVAIMRVKALSRSVDPFESMLASLAALAGRVGSIVLEGAGERLIDTIEIAKLDALAQACRAVGLPFGLAGGLESPDVARLLVLKPDMLGFDVALRRDHRAQAGLDPAAVEAIRALIPHGPRSVGASLHTDETDQIFVHDFVALLSIGAYQAERGVRQRVRFSVDAAVRRPAEPPTDMRGVFSYDIIIETIRVLASRAHVTFVETLAEELAATLLTYPQLSVVTVKVEKLDVIEGAVGVVITRHRQTAYRAVRA